LPLGQVPAARALVVVARGGGPPAVARGAGCRRLTWASLEAVARAGSRARGGGLPRADWRFALACCQCACLGRALVWAEFAPGV
jgi:hypothetical protein